MSNTNTIIANVLFFIAFAVAVYGTVIGSAILAGAAFAFTVAAIAVAKSTTTTRQAA